jgi:mono/diheme cytochrome c family protein
VLAGLILVAAIADRIVAQEARTTLSGVYTLAQAEKGEDVYYGSCVNCHPKGTYAGPAFKANWGGRPLSDLYDWVKTKMPKSDPGSLTPNQSVQVMAYILQQNKMPPGPAPMPTDRAVLGTIKIQLK